MVLGFSLGDAKEINGLITVAVSGRIDISTMDEFEVLIRRHIRVPGLVLDFTGVTVIDGKGELKLLKIWQDYPRAPISLINVHECLRPKLKRLGEFVSIQYLREDELPNSA